MNKSTLSLVFPCLLLIFGCSVEQSVEEPLSANPIFQVFDAKVDHFEGRGETNGCFEVDLTAGQTFDAGSVNVDIVGDALVITYLANEEWIINATHLSIGDCDEQSFPTTGSGNPKIGHFEHSSEHPEGTNEVVYTISLDILEAEFCFAAHAEVSGPNGEETGWASNVDAIPFSGSSWAVYIEAYLEGCTGDDDGGPVQK